MAKGEERMSGGVMAKESKDFLVSCNDVYVEYPSTHSPITKKVLNDIDLRVSAGEFVTVVGPTGCGKSTMLRLILGAEKPTHGTVLIDGVEFEKPDRNRGIVFQRYSLFPHLTVLENVAFGLRLEAFNVLGNVFRPISFWNRKQTRMFNEEATEYLGRVGLGDDGHKYPHQLSGGMRQRVAIAQALVMKPKILLMDEPFGALDDETRQVMQFFILEQWHQSNMTIFFVTHDLEEALFLGTRILVVSPYYSTDKGKGVGSKIVTDKALPNGHPRSTTFKYSSEFNAILQQVREDGLNPDNLQHVSKFDLSHPDSFRSVSLEEWSQQ